MKIQYKRILASILFVLISFVCIAQGDGAPPVPGPPPLPGSPIDGGILAGICFAIFYGIKKVLGNKK